MNGEHVKAQMDQMWAGWAQKFGRRPKKTNQRGFAVARAGLMAVIAIIVGKAIANWRTPSEIAATAS